MSLLKAKAPHSLRWRDWLKRHLLPEKMAAAKSNPSELNTIKSDIPEVDSLINPLINLYHHLSNHFDAAHQEVFECTGVDSVYKETIPAPDIVVVTDPKDDILDNRPRLFDRIVMLLGLPNRLTEYQLRSQDGQKVIKRSYHHRFWQVLKNLIGGWDSSPDIHPEKQFWQLLSLLTVKIFLFLPINLLILLPQFFINKTKWITEFTATFALRLTAHAIHSTTATFDALSNPEISYSLPDQSLPLKPDPLLPENTAQIDPDLYQYDDFSNVDTLPSEQTQAFWQSNSTSHYFKGLALIVGIGILHIPYIALRIITLVFRASFSPEKNARAAFAYCRELKVSLFGKVAKPIISFGFGVIGFLVSIAITATFWAIALPVIVGVIVKLSPLILAATPTLVIQTATWVWHLPQVIHAIAWLSHLPQAIASFSIIKGALLTLGSTLAVGFSPVITAVSGLIGISLSPTALSITIALAVLAAPTLVILSKIASVICNAWASPWKNGGPITWMASALTLPDDTDDIPLSEQSTLEDNPAPESDHLADAEDSTSPRPDPLKLAESARSAIMNSEDSDVLAELRRAYSSSPSPPSSGGEQQRPPTLSPRSTHQTEAKTTDLSIK